MKQEKKHKILPITEPPLSEGKSQPITATSAMDSTLPEWVRLAAHPGYVVNCGMCKREIWTGHFDEDMVYICGPCAEELPE